MTGFIPWRNYDKYPRGTMSSDPEYFAKLKEAEDGGDTERAEKLRAAREAYQRYAGY